MFWINLPSTEYTALEEYWERYLYWIKRSQLVPSNNALLINSYRVRAHFYEDQYWYNLEKLKKKYLRNLYRALLNNNSPLILPPGSYWSAKGAPHQIIRTDIPPAPKGDHLLPPEDRINW